MKVLAIGRSEFLYESILQIQLAGHELVGICTAKASPEYRSQEIDFIMLADDLGVPFLFSANVSKICSWVSSLPLPPEIAISVNFPTKVGGDLLALFKFGILNAHGGDLPRYRGNACTAWAILNGEEHIGLCVHRMEPSEIDSGPVFVRRKYPLAEETYIGDVYRVFERDIPVMFCEALDLIEADPSYAGVQQNTDPSNSLRCFPRIDTDRQIDWNRAANSISRLIRASSAPYGGAYSFYNGRKIAICRGNVYESLSPFLAIPGQILEIVDEGIIIACSDGAICASELREDGRVINDFRSRFPSIRTRFGLA